MPIGKFLIHHEIASSEYGNCSLLNTIFILSIDNIINSIIEIEDNKEEQEKILHSFFNSNIIKLSIYYTYQILCNI